MLSSIFCLIVVMAIIANFYGCKKTATIKNENTPPPAKPEKTILIAAGGVKVDSIPKLNSVLVAVDSISVTFTDGVESRKIQSGNILSSGVNAIAPFGFLRRVISIGYSGGNVVCSTTQARLSDAIINTSVASLFRLMICSKTLQNIELLLQVIWHTPLHMHPPGRQFRLLSPTILEMLLSRVNWIFREPLMSTYKCQGQGSKNSKWILQLLNPYQSLLKTKKQFRVHYLTIYLPLIYLHCSSMQYSYYP